jgi:hypothetical protein
MISPKSSLVQMINNKSIDTIQVLLKLLS